MSSYKKIVGGLVLAVLFAILPCMIISVLLKTKADLSDITGIVDGQQLIHDYGAKSSFDAYVISVTNSELKFAVQDNKERAFNFLSRNNIVGKHIEIWYDPNGHNQSPDLTYHIYEVTVNNNQIMTMGEAKATYKWGLIVVIAIYSLFVALYFWARRKKSKRIASNTQTSPVQ